MPRSRYGRFRDGLEVAGLTIQVPHVGKTFYVNNSTTAAELQPYGIGGSDGNHGETPEKPFSTIDKAINSASAGRGDVIYVLPGHAETIADATSLVPDVSHISIIGLGEGEKRPIITFATSTAAAIPITGANTLIKNIVFKCNIASQNHMLDIAADDVTIEDCEFREGSATGLSFITADTADGDSDRLTIRRCKFHMPTAGNGDNAIQLAKDFTGVVIDDVDIYGDFDLAAIEVPAGGNAQVNLKIMNSRVTNLLTGVHAIEINGTSSTGMILNTYCQGDTLGTIIDAGGLEMINTWEHGGVDQERGQLAGTIQDSAENFIGVDDSNNVAATTNVAANEDGTVLERLEQLQEAVNKGTGTAVAANKSLADAIGFDGSAVVTATSGMLRTQMGNYFYISKSLTSSAILTTGVDVTGVSSGGALELVKLAVMTDGTGLAAGTNLTLETDNANGLAVFFTEAVADLGANKTESLSGDDAGTADAGSFLPILESGKKIVAKCTVANCTGSGVAVVHMVFRRLADNAVIAAA